MKTITEDIKTVLFDEQTVRRRVAEMGAEITRDYPDHSEDLILIGILKGAVVFMADLIREIERPVYIDFMSVSSYGKGKAESRGVVRILKDLDEDILNKHVLLVEDIVDSGLTLSYLSDIMVRRGAKSVKIASLLNKAERRVNIVKIDYCGFPVPNEFIVGYGLDYSETYRHLTYIGALKESVYK
ncbi:MAG: hypoxanthine phosphoribosyltransferase [Tissierellia bacterium]|nr:hypoxanthine phosphoribosyltransferase [Tissierellia bacterium]